MKKFIISIIVSLFCTISFAQDPWMRAKDSLKVISAQYVEQSTNTLTFLKETLDSLNSISQSAPVKPKKVYANAYVVAPTVTVKPSHDSQGLNTVYFSFINNYKKTIKYYTLHVSYKNQVGDPCKDELGRTITSLKGIGPIAPGACESGSWDTIYDSWCVLVKVNSISITFMDDSSVSVAAVNMLPKETQNSVEAGNKYAKEKVEWDSLYSDISKKIDYFSLKETTFNKCVSTLKKFLSKPSSVMNYTVECAMHDIDKINEGLGLPKFSVSYTQYSELEF